MSRIQVQISIRRSLCQFRFSWRRLIWRHLESDAPCTSQPRKFEREDVVASTRSSVTKLRKVVGLTLASTHLTLAAPWDSMETIWSRNIDAWNQ